MSLLIIVIISVSLSMDAFSLSLAYGTLGLNKNKILQLSVIVGIYHFIMPILGMLIGGKLLKFLPIRPIWIVFFILTLIGIQMIIESFKEEKKVSNMGLIELLMFGFAVSIDSFSVGIGLEAISNNYFLCSFCFSLSSFSFTYLGLILGKKINSLIGKISTILGGSVLILIGIIYLFQ